MYKITINLPIGFDNNDIKESIGSFLSINPAVVGEFSLLKLSLDSRKKQLHYLATVIFDLVDKDFFVDSTHSTNNTNHSTDNTTFATDSTSKLEKSTSSTDYTGSVVDSTNKLGKSNSSTSSAGSEVNSTSKLGKSNSSTSSVGKLQNELKKAKNSINKLIAKGKVELYEKKPSYIPAKCNNIPPLPPVIVGSGPAGLFAGLILAFAGLNPIIIERGDTAENRYQKILDFRKTRVLDTSSNIQFGEGGAGTFSDGKLNTLTKDFRNNFVKEVFYKFGATEDILYLNKPHIGTDKLIKIIPNIRNEIIRLGGKVLFNHTVTDFVLNNGKISALKVNSNGNEIIIQANDVILATGHSARDTFYTLRDLGAKMEQKPFSIGVRIEHPREYINAIQYGENIVQKYSKISQNNSYNSSLGEKSDNLVANIDRIGTSSHKDKQINQNYCLETTKDIKNNNKSTIVDKVDAKFDKIDSKLNETVENFYKTDKTTNISKLFDGKCENNEILPTADYKLSCHLPNGRSVYTFCMCPGGEVVNASSEDGYLVTNGMSNYMRMSRNSNSAVLVNVTTSDFPSSDVLAGVEFQRKYEKLAFSLTKNYLVPCQLVGDFINDVPSTKLGEVVPTPEYQFAELKKCLPKFATESLKLGLKEFDKKMKGFLKDDAVLLGVETRTSSPVRIVRNSDYESNILGLYPCGEGAGYAGGIMSAAVDGIKVAEKLIEKYNNIY